MRAAWGGISDAPRCRVPRCGGPVPGLGHGAGAGAGWAAGAKATPTRHSEMRGSGPHERLRRELPRTSRAVREFEPLLPATFRPALARRFRLWGKSVATSGVRAVLGARRSGAAVSRADRPRRVSRGRFSRTRRGGPCGSFAMSRMPNSASCSMTSGSCLPLISRCRSSCRSSFRLSSIGSATRSSGMTPIPSCWTQSCGSSMV
jgi:hypothetical protein